MSYTIISIISGTKRYVVNSHKDDKLFLKHGKLAVDRKGVGGGSSVEKTTKWGLKTVSDSLLRT